MIKPKPQQVRTSAALERAGQTHVFQGTGRRCRQCEHPRANAIHPPAPAKGRG